MPTYDYKCKSCGNTWELFQSMSAKPVKACPKCGKKTAERLIGTGAALLFKGSGFYQTDYRSEGYRKSAEADKKSSSGGDAKPADKPGESKPATASTSEAPAKPKAEAKTESKPSSAKPKKKDER